MSLGRGMDCPFDCFYVISFSFPNSLLVDYFLLNGSSNYMMCSWTCADLHYRLIQRSATQVNFETKNDDPYLNCQYNNIIYRKHVFLQFFF